MVGRAVELKVGFVALTEEGASVLFQQKENLQNHEQEESL